MRREALIQPSSCSMNGRERDGRPSPNGRLEAPVRPESGIQPPLPGMGPSRRFDPDCRTPPAPHEKGAVESQVRTARPHFFPNGLSWAKRTQHVHFKTRTVWQADPEEKPRGFADRSPFDSDKLPPRRHAPPPDLF